MATVLLDGQRVEFESGFTIGNILPGLDPQICVAVIRPGSVSHTETRQFLLKTTAGEIVVETSGSSDLLRSAALFSDLMVRWEDRQTVSFGPFPAVFQPSRHSSRYDRGDLILGCGGYDPDHAVLVFTRRTHSADHGAAADGGVIGSVVSGRGIIDRLGPGDRILGVEPVISFAESVDAFTTTDMSCLLEDGMQVISYIGIVAQGTEGGSSSEVAESVETLLLALREGRFICNQRMSTHIRSDSLAGTNVAYQLGGPRREGAVLMRTSGKNRGSVYIYTQDLPRSLAHTLVGQVIHGIELAKLAKEHDFFQVRINPLKCDLIGMTLEAAVCLTEERGIRLISDTTGSDRMIIRQDPINTLEVLQAGEVRVETVSLSQVIDIILDDDRAPDTCRIFREVSGLKYHDVGSFEIFFAFDEVYLFQAEIPKTINVKPENTPEGEVPASMLAMTNESRRGVGMIGIRTVSSTEFGPTSEPFSGTNIMGRVLDPGKLSGLDEGDMVYFREVRQ
ncbi:MAG TPA: methanogenesis marker 3 protein [Methanospirillum sp.]|nr:methanogenesis marker 3 protein [Methanospirillum sp.]